MDTQTRRALVLAIKALGDRRRHYSTYENAARQGFAFGANGYKRYQAHEQAIQILTGLLDSEVRLCWSSAKRRATVRSRAAAWPHFPGQQVGSRTQPHAQAPGKVGACLESDCVIGNIGPAQISMFPRNEAE